MNLNELTYNPFDIVEYEHFLLELFNVNLSIKEDLSYLYNQESHGNIANLFYYGSFMDDDFNDIELYVIKLRNIDDYRDIQDVIFNLLSLNQTNHAFITVFSDFSHEWFFSYLFLEYRVEDNKLVNYKSGIDDFIHWCGDVSCDNLLSNLLTMKVSSDNLRDLLKNNPESMLIMSLSDLMEKLDSYQKNSSKAFDSYKLLIKVLISIVNHKKPKSSLMLKVYDRIRELEKSTDEDVTIDTVYELYNYLNNQQTVSKTHIKSVCEDTLIEYLSQNTIISREDITIYVKYAYSNHKLISKHIGEAIHNGGRSFTNMKIPLSVIYNIDTINQLLEEMKILDFSINSCITITTFTYLLTTLKYVNRLIQGYTQISLDELFKSTLKDNIYMITLNKQSLTTAKTLLKGDKNLLFTDALNLYDEYPIFIKELESTDLNNTKTEVLNQIICNYNQTHFHTKINNNFEENFKQKHGYMPLIYQLDFKEVFLNKRGFDIIISNVEHLDLTGKKEYKKQLRRYKLYDNNQRYEYYYIEKALELINDTGIISLVLDDEYRASSDDNICKIIKQNNILKIDDNELIYKRGC